MTPQERAEKEFVMRRLKMACCLCLAFMVVEVIGGVISKSLAVLSDAAHLFTDLSSFVIAIIANYLSMRPANDKVRQRLSA
tara:strand:+ start:476 stop:718 length:243 start_codon:yes stop_codon:yes gene_type:complete